MSNSSASEKPTTISNTNLQLPDHEEQEDADFLAAAQILQSGTLPLALKTAVELNIFGIMAKAGLPLSPNEIAAELPACQNPDAPSLLDRVLRLLACHSVVSCSVVEAADGNVERRYGLGVISRFFVGDENGISLGPFISLVEDPIVRASWLVLSFLFFSMNLVLLPFPNVLPV